MHFSSATSYRAIVSVLPATVAKINTSIEKQGSFISQKVIMIKFNAYHNFNRKGQIAGA